MLTAPGGLTVEIFGSGSLSYTSLRLDRPPRFVVDLPDVLKGAVPASIEVGRGLLERIRVGQFQLSPRPVCRVVFDLASAAEPAIEAAGPRVTVRFGPAEAPDDAREPAEPTASASGPPASPPPTPTHPVPPDPARPASAAPAAAGPAPRATELRGVEVLTDDSAAEIRLTGDGWLPYSSYRLPEPDRLVIELHGVRSEHPPGPIPAHLGPLTGVQVIGLAAAEGPAVRLVVGLRGEADSRVETTRSGLIVTVVTVSAGEAQGGGASPMPPAAEPFEAFAHDPLLAASLPSYPSLHLAGFSDVDYSDSEDPAAPQAFSEGQLVLHLSSALSPRLSFFGEVALTARDDRVEVTMERGLIRYDHSDRLKVSLGRYHTPVSWWNTAYHHGAWLHTTIARPEMAAFGGAFLPLHFVGGMAEGTFPAGGLNLGYRAGLGNGRALDPRRPGDAGDVNSSLAWLVSLGVRPGRPFGLEAGGALYVDRLSPAEGPEVDERIASAYLVWQRPGGELIAEVAEVRHEPARSEETLTSRAYYVQAAYRLPWAGERLKPYYRFESIEIPAGDRVFAGVRELRGSTFGLRLDFAQFAAFKAEYRLWERPGPREDRDGFAQVAFTF